MIGTAAPAAAQGSSQPVRFTFRGTADGLSNSAVTALAQDSGGFLWVGTEDGLNRFDGQRFTTYRRQPGDAVSLPSSRISALYLDPAGTLWIGTHAGVARFDPETDTFVRIPGACQGRISAFGRGQDGTLWVGARDELCYADANGLVAASIVEEDGTTFAGSYGVYIMDEEDGELWVWAHRQSHFSMLSCRVERRVCRIGPPTTEASSMTATLHRVPHTPLRRRMDARYSEPSQLQQGRIQADPGSWWIATEARGVLGYDAASESLYDVAPPTPERGGLRGWRVLSMLRDRQGAIWVGTEEGLHRQQTAPTGAFAHITPAHGLSDARINGIRTGSDGRVWVTTIEGVTTLETATGDVRTYDRAGGGSFSNAFWSVLPDVDGETWVGSKRESLFRVLDDGTLEPIVFEAVEATSPTYGIRHLFRDDVGRIWVASSKGLHWTTASADTLYALNTPSPVANRLHQDRHGGLWVGTDHGVCQIGQRGRSVGRCFGQSDHPDSLAHAIVWGFAETGRAPDVLWASTVGGGLCGLPLVPMPEARVDCLQTQDGLPSNTVFGVVTGPRGYLWISTDAGLARVDPEARSVVAFGAADGLPFEAFDLMAFAAGPDSTLYFGGRQGLIRVDPARLRASEYVPPVVITSVDVLGEALAQQFMPGDTLHLDHTQDMLRFRFAALDYAAPDRTRYRYRLLGYESGWTHATADEPTARYTRVPPGRYTFEVLGSNAAGRFAPEPTRLHVVIQPALWQTGAFRFATVALVLALGASVVLARRRRRMDAVRREAEEAREMRQRLAQSRERERNRLARELHDGPIQDLYRIGHDLDLMALSGRHAEAEPLADLCGDGHKSAAPAFGPPPTEVREAVNHVTRDLRETLRALRPPLLDEMNLVEAIEIVLSRCRRRHPDVHFEAEMELSAKAEALLARPALPEDAVPTDARGALYRITHEAVQNALRHAQARTIRVTLREEASAVVLQVEDDGRGFEPPPRLLDLARADHFGLIGIYERAEQVGADLTVHSAPGAGTRVVLTLPTAVEVARP